MPATAENSLTPTTSSQSIGSRGTFQDGADCCGTGGRTIAGTAGGGTGGGTIDGAEGGTTGGGVIAGLSAVSVVMGTFVSARQRATASGGGTACGRSRGRSDCCSCSRSFASSRSN